MAWTAPRTWVAAETLTAALLNTHVRDNLLESAPAKVTTKGDLVVATAANSLTRLAVGSNGAVLVSDSAATSGTRWSSTGRTASAGVAHGVLFDTTLTAAANSDALLFTHLSQCVVASGTYTDLTIYGLRVAGGNFTKTGTGTIGTAYGLYVSAPSIGTTNWALYGLDGNYRLGGTSSKVFIGDDANASATAGITVNSGTSAGEVFSAKNSLVAHGVTSVTETDTYGYIAISNAGATPGGVEIGGLRTGSASYGIRLRSIVVAGDTTKSTAAVAAVTIQSASISGTSTASLGANTNLLNVTDNGTTRFILDADGDSHQDVGTAWTNFDDRDDVQALNLLAAHVTRADDPLRRNFTEWLEQDRAPLEAARVVTFNDDGHHFVNWSRANMLVIGAVRQLGQRLTDTLARLEAAEDKLRLLEA